MSHTIWVLLEKAKLPTVKELGSYIQAQGFALEIDTDWDWDDFMGWLPMQWRGEEHGCEIVPQDVTAEDEIDEELEAAASAGCKNVDFLVEISVRGTEDIQCGVIFAACLAKLTGGCVTEEDDEYILGDELVPWANTSIESADKWEVEFAEQQKAREQALARIEKSSSVEQEFRDVLQSFTGQKVEIRFPRIAVEVASSGDDENDDDGPFDYQAPQLLGFQLSSGHSIQGYAWVLTVDGKSYTCARRKKFRSQQFAELAQFADDGDSDDETISPEEQQALDKMDDALAQASKLDLQDADAVAQLLSSRTEEDQIETIRWKEPSCIELVLKGHDKFTVEFSGEELMTDITVSSPPLQFSLGDELDVM